MRDCCSVVRMVDPWAWTLTTTLVVVGWGVTFAIAVTGWVITAIRDRRAAKAAKDKAEADAEEAQRKFDAQLNVLKGQLKASNETVEALRTQVKATEDSADALRGQLAAQRTQARLAEETASVPKWDIYQVQNLKYAVANENTFDAHDVRVVLSSGKEYELGNISKGSSIGFMFMEKAIMCEDGYADIRITWSLPGESGERHSVTKPSPQYVH